MADRMLLIAEAQRKGFSVVPDEENGGWLIEVPAKPRTPANLQGTFKTHERAWSAACLISQEYP